MAVQLGKTVIDYAEHPIRDQILKEPKAIRTLFVVQRSSFGAFQKYLEKKGEQQPLEELFEGFGNQIECELVTQAQLNPKGGFHIICKLRMLKPAVGISPSIATSIARDYYGEVLVFVHSHAVNELVEWTIRFNQ